MAIRGQMTDDGRQAACLAIHPLSFDCAADARALSTFGSYRATSTASWPDLFRPSTSSCLGWRKEDVDARDISAFTRVFDALPARSRASSTRYQRVHARL